MKIIALNQAYYFNINKITRSFFVCKIVYFEENIYNISPKSFFPFLKVAQLLMKSFLAMKSSIATLFYVLPELQGKMCVIAKIIRIFCFYWNIIENFFAIIPSSDLIIFLLSDKRSHIIKKTCSFKLQVCSSMCDLLMDIRH